MAYMTKCNMKNVLYSSCSLKSVAQFKRKLYFFLEREWKVINSQAVIMTPTLNCYVAFDKLISAFENEDCFAFPYAKYFEDVTTMLCWVFFIPFSVYPVTVYFL